MFDGMSHAATRRDASGTRSEAARDVGMSEHGWIAGSRGRLPDGGVSVNPATGSLRPAQGVPAVLRRAACAAASRAMGTRNGEQLT